MTFIPDAHHPLVSDVVGQMKFGGGGGIHAGNLPEVITYRRFVRIIFFLLMTGVNRVVMGQVFLPVLRFSPCQYNSTSAPYLFHLLVSATDAV